MILKPAIIGSTSVGRSKTATLLTDRSGTPSCRCHLTSGLRDDVFPLLKRIRPPSYQHVVSRLVHMKGSLVRASRLALHERSGLTARGIFYITRRRDTVKCYYGFLSPCMIISSTILACVIHSQT